MVSGKDAKDGKIAALAWGTESLEARQPIDAKGKYVLPGIVDPENHLGTHRPLRAVSKLNERIFTAEGRINQT